MKMKKYINIGLIILVFVTTIAIVLFFIKTPKLSMNIKERNVTLDGASYMSSGLRDLIKLFSTEIKSGTMRLTQDERGFVITLLTDTFFYQDSTQINLETAQDVFLRLNNYLSSDDMAGRIFKIEGHTDNADVNPECPWEDNRQLSVELADSIKRYLVDLGIDENRFKAEGFGDSLPVAGKETSGGRAANRRVEIIISNYEQL